MAQASTATTRRRVPRSSRNATRWGAGGGAGIVFPALAAGAETAGRIAGRDLRAGGRARLKPLDRVFRPQVSGNQNMPIIYIQSGIGYIPKELVFVVAVDQSEIVRKREGRWDVRPASPFGNLTEQTLPIVRDARMHVMGYCAVKITSFSEWFPDRESATGETTGHWVGCDWSVDGLRSSFPLWHQPPRIRLEP